MAKRGGRSGSSRTRMRAVGRPAGKSALKTKGPKAPPVLTQKELDQFASRVVAHANELLADTDDSRELLADFLFRELFDGNATLALDPFAKSSPRYRAVSARAGASLLLEPEELSLHVAVGAMNDKVAAVSFRGVPWTCKVALIPLARRGMWKELRAATDVLDRDHAGTRAFRAHLRAAHPEIYRGNPNSPTALAGETTRMVNTVGRLDEGSVARFVDDLNRGSPEARQEVKDKIRRGLALLTYLNEAIDDGGDGNDGNGGNDGA